ncbi:exopolysaccharide biosynthesis polyprenyl glycosylphosphotransferase [Trichothermofontia sp.]
MSFPAPNELFPVTVVGDVYLIQTPPRLTVQVVVPFKQCWETLCRQSPLPKRLILDMGRTVFMDSSGVGVLVRIVSLSQVQNNIETILWSLNDQPKTVLKVSGLFQFFQIDDRTTAIVTADLMNAEDPLSATHPSVRSRWKRLMDISGAIVGLWITGLLLPFIALAIRWESPGPIFFGQIRLGLTGKPFRMWKFRSMVINAEALKADIPNEASGAIFKNQNDPRVTRVGRFLRRTSLDELPQFWNVLRGEMSLVGTRPPTPQEVGIYEIPQWQRLDVKPGMTGEWQVNGRSQVRNFEDIIALDLRYQENWSLWYDCQLILKTIWIIFQKNSGAV